MKTNKVLPIALCLVLLCTLILSNFTRVNGQENPTLTCITSEILDGSQNLATTSQKNCPSCDVLSILTENVPDEPGKVWVKTTYIKRNNFIDINVCVNSDIPTDKCTQAIGNPLYIAPDCEPTYGPKYDTPNNTNSNSNSDSNTDTNTDTGTDTGTGTGTGTN